MKKLIAKSSGIPIDEHSSIISKNSLLFLRKMSSDEDYKRFEHRVKYSSLLHDIGKLTTNFQRYLLGKIKKTGLKFRHNEIGWAFLSKYLSDDFVDKDYILNIVYWHHGISNQMEKHTDRDILSDINDESINNMLEYLISCVGEENINEDMESDDSIRAPLFYPSDGPLKKNLHQLQLARSIVITSDRVSSDMTSESDVKDSVIDDYFNLKKEVKITETKFDGTPRFEKQKSIVDEANGTTIIKAPAGFGKTIMGVMWSFKYNKKVIWVTPRNTIAESLYLSVIEEFENLNINPTIQLILSGEIKHTNNDDLGMYDADVIITNIDNFLLPNFNNSIMDASSLLLSSTVIFDEYHELITDAPLMSLFVGIMRTRHRLTRASTLLLSATPVPCEHLWDTLSNKTVVLPNKETHYPAVHDKHYLIKVTNEKQYIKPNTNTLVVKNTISSSQKGKMEGEYSLLLHSSFIDEKKEEDFRSLIHGYNKRSEINPNKSNVIGTHIIQASLDISFNNLFEDVMSPQSTLQRIGRCDRFGNCEGESVVTIIKELPDGYNDSTIRSEASIKSLLYNKNLSDMWFDFLSDYNNARMTLDELYVVYNDFNRIYEVEIKRYIQSRFDESTRLLSKIHPFKVKEKKRDDKVMTAGSNKLRSVNSEVFYIVEHEDGKSWVGPFTKQIIRDFKNEFNETGNIMRRMVKTMEKIRNSNDERFEYNDIIDSKKVAIEDIRDRARKSNTPYIAYDRYYDDELGIIIKKK